MGKLVLISANLIDLREDGRVLIFVSLFILLPYVVTVGICVVGRGRSIFFSHCLFRYLCTVFSAITPNPNM